MTPLLLERLQTVAENLKSAGTLRPKDVLNFATMVWSLPKAPADRPQPTTPGQVALTMLTRMHMSYQPETDSVRAAPREPVSYASFAEPTVALFVDAPEHLSGVSLTLQSWAEEAKRLGKPFYLHMAGTESGIPGAKSFPKVGTFRLSSYEGLEIPVPDVKAVTDFMRGHPFDIAHLSTPGPMGLLGMRLARDRGAPVCGTYHTDFPRYVRDLTQSRELEEATWAFMCWFYGQMDLVAVPSRSTGEDLVAHGLDPDRIRVVGRGVEQSTFSPARRDEALRREWGAEPDTPVLLYVGRVSKEKNLPLLADAFLDLHRRGNPARLVIVGDGPYRAEMEARLAGTPALFTGLKHGADLSAAFASADLFVFPSVTDTFGRVIIEAQASGLPVLVSDQGGPRDAILPEQTGRIVTGLSPETFVRETEALLRDRPRLRQWSAAARRHAEAYTPEASFNAFWDLHRNFTRTQEPCLSVSIRG
ncbi:MAG: glycosyltransferase family 1 protein [Verrucomicrobia bacterium]|nr:glycosyltransferase family 1 protein [Verrucomicrobiota bacterium]MCH8526506.1 glycosyltransferase family 1 protein [Kiritimatiellia bacterium]